nr:caspase-3-like [Drosophila bipectinata]
MNPTNTQDKKKPSVPKNIVNAPRPLVLIFNHHIFEDGSEREGTAQDVEALHRTFTSLNCDVNEILNPKLADIKNIFKKLELDCLMHLPALVIVILSHGGRNDMISTCDGRFYNLNDDVLYPLFRNETLRGKPKILITQACKGNLEVDASPIKSTPTEYIKCYSTTEGFRSYRDSVTGSCYIQALCIHLNLYGRKWDFQTIIQKVGVQVANETYNGKKQIPTFVPSLNKKFYFGHNVYTDGNPNVNQ